MLCVPENKGRFLVPYRSFHTADFLGSIDAAFIQNVYLRPRPSALAAKSAPGRSRNLRASKGRPSLQEDKASSDDDTKSVK